MLPVRKKKGLKPLPSSLQAQGSDIPASTSTVLDVDLEAIAHNYRFVQEKIGHRVCAPAIKANAYGLGMIPVGKALWAIGARDFFVATLEEGITLRQHLPFATIYVLNGLWAGTESLIHRHQLTPVLGDLGQVVKWKQFAHKVDELLPAILQVDTGLVRLGLSLAEVQKLAKSSKELEGVSLKYLMSHLACAYQPDHIYNVAQRDAFLQAQKLFPEVPVSLSGSGGMFQGSEYFFDMVRPGRILYGSTFTAGEDFIGKVKHVITLRARILQIQDVPQGHSVGYDQTYRAEKPLRLATLGIGYADGYFRCLSNRGYGFINGVRVPVVGRISMDLMTVDVTNVPENMAYPGAWVELINADMTIDDLATLADTVSWEILTRLGERPFRRYIGEEE